MIGGCLEFVEHWTLVLLRRTRKILFAGSITFGEDYWGLLLRFLNNIFGLLCALILGVKLSLERRIWESVGIRVEFWTRYCLQLSLRDFFRSKTSRERNLDHLDLFKCEDDDYFSKIESLEIILAIDWALSSAWRSSLPSGLKILVHLNRGCRLLHEVL